MHKSKTKQYLGEKKILPLSFQRGVCRLQSKLASQAFSSALYFVLVGAYVCLLAFSTYFRVCMCLCVCLYVCVCLCVCLCVCVCVCVYKLHFGVDYGVSMTRSTALFSRSCKACTETWELPSRMRRPSQTSAISCRKWSAAWSHLQSIAPPSGPSLPLLTVRYAML